jgi:D-alanine-D-alanine ligase
MPMTVGVVLADDAQPDPFQISNALPTADAAALAGLRTALHTLQDYHFVYFSDHVRLFHELSSQRARIDLVLNLCDKGLHNDWTKEAHVPALLEILGVPYTGAGPRSLVWCFDKALVYGAASALGVAVPRFECAPAAEVAWSGPYPAFVKPNFADGSFGITREAVARDASGVTRAVAAMREAFDYDDLVIVQEYLPGKDLSVGVVGNADGSFRALPILEESYAAVPEGTPHVGSYEAKWDSEAADSPYHGLSWLRAELAPELEHELVTWSLALAKRLECHDYARVDFRLDARGQPRLLEVNPNPGWDYWTYLATMAGFADLTYPDLLRGILDAACARHGLARAR